MHDVCFDVVLQGPKAQTMCFLAATCFMYPDFLERISKIYECIPEKLEIAYRMSLPGKQKVLCVLNSLESHKRMMEVVEENYAEQEAKWGR